MQLPISTVIKIHSQPAPKTASSAEDSLLHHLLHCSICISSASPSNLSSSPERDFLQCPINVIHHFRSVDSYTTQNRYGHHHHLLPVFLSIVKVQLSLHLVLLTTPLSSKIRFLRRPYRTTEAAPPSSGRAVLRLRTSLYFDTPQQHRPSIFNMQNFHCQIHLLFHLCPNPLFPFLFHPLSTWTYIAFRFHLPFLSRLKRIEFLLVLVPFFPLLHINVVFLHLARI